MNVLIIARGYPSSRDPMWGNFERDQALALQRLGHNITIMSVDCRFRLYRRQIGISSFQENGFSIYSLFYIPIILLSCMSFSLSRIYKERMVLKLFRRILQDGVTPDVIYVHYLANIEACRLIKKHYNIPIVGVEHWSEINKKKIKRSVYRLGLYGYCIPDKLFTVSLSLQNQIKKIWGKDSEVLPNMVDEIFFQDGVRHKNFNELVEFISIGSLIYRKGFDLLIRAFAQSNVSRKKWRLKIVGSGSELNNLQRLSKSLGVADNVIFVGQKNRTEIRQMLSESNCFILSSRCETFGVVFIEAMALGLPVIGTNCGGPEEIINDSNGLLVPTEDINALSMAIEKMIDNIHSYNTDDIVMECEEKYSPNIISKKIESTFMKLLQNSI